MLSTDGLWPPPNHFVSTFDTFEQDVAADARLLTQVYAALDSDALMEVFTRAARFGDLKRIALAGPALHAEGRLPRPYIFLLGRALMASGHPADALEAFLHPDVRGHPNVKYVRARIAAMARVGWTGLALEELERAQELHPTFALDDLRAPLATLLSLSAQENELADRRLLQQLGGAYLALGLQPRASHVLARARAEQGGWPSLADLIEWAELALRALSPGQVLAELLTAPASDRDDLRWRTLATAAAALIGEQPDLSEGPENRSLLFWRALAHERRGDLAAAVAGLCELADEDKTNLDIRMALARNVGRMVLDQVRPAFAPGRTGRVINLVPFFNELRMLRVHLEEMSPWVDKFVIVEGVKTFTGADKPLLFEANRHLFADFADKIVHVPVRAFPEHLTSAWARDFYQRDMSIAGASGLCGEEDYILETDVDELIDYRALEGLEADFSALDLRLSRFFLNYRPAPGNPRRTQPKATIFKAKHRATHGVSLGRFFLAHHREAYLARDAGWHFTSMFDEHGISLKVNSYAHQEHQKAKFRTSEHFLALRQRLLAGELDPDWERVELDDTFPASLLRNREVFSDVIL